MEYSFTAMGALLGLTAAILLIFKKVPPVYSLILGALLGGLLGGGSPDTTISAMISGAEGMMSTVLRILASGILAGGLIQTGAAERIAEIIAGKLGSRYAAAAIALAAMILCAVGVFADIAVITAAPIALALGRKADLSVQSVLIAMIGGVKAGNILSPNPNTIAAAEAFGVDLTALMLKNGIPALCALGATVLIATLIASKGRQVSTDTAAKRRELPGILPAAAGPLTVILLLMLCPLAGWKIDPLIVLPLGGLVTILAAGRGKDMVSIAAYGLEQVSGVSVLLIGMGAVAGILQASSLQADMLRLLDALHLHAFVLAPLSGVLMAGAASSTTAGAAIASRAFAPTLLEAGVPALSAAAMIHAGATVLDSLPHGSFFHATGAAVGLSLGERMKLIPLEAAVGLVSTLTATALYLIVQ